MVTAKWFCPRRENTHSKEMDKLTRLVSSETNLQIICSLHKEFDFDSVTERIERVANESVEPQIKAYKDYIEQLESQLRTQEQKFREQDEQIVFHFFQSSFRSTDYYQKSRGHTGRCQ